jgi:hypothetical protein
VLKRCVMYSCATLAISLQNLYSNFRRNLTKTIISIIHTDRNFYQRLFPDFSQSPYENGLVSGVMPSRVW